MSEHAARHDLSTAPPPSYTVRRHGPIVRITHWINVLCMTILLMSGLQIFNAHPALYVGHKSDFDNPVMAMGSAQRADGSAIGVTSVLGRNFETTGVLGLSKVSDGSWAVRGFPSWATIPGYQNLAVGRRWHFFFAWLFVINGLVYAAAKFGGGTWRGMIPSGAQLRHIGASIREHVMLRFPRGEEARRYNVLQKLAYLGLLVIAIPLLILAGMAMSPAMDAIAPWLVSLFGGRQTARTIHFIMATLILGFVVVHVVMVLVSGFLNNMRAMITGRYRIEPEAPHHAED